MPAVKIGTCHYCGTRAALVLRGDKRHELACSTCGAPLHDLKMMPRQALKPAKAHRAHAAPSHARAMSKPPKRPKKRKSFKRRFFEEVFDLVEDIFD